LNGFIAIRSCRRQQEIKKHSRKSGNDAKYRQS
jgi:hypothetical protein